MACSRFHKKPFVYFILSQKWCSGYKHHAIFRKPDAKNDVSKCHWMFNGLWMKFLYEPCQCIERLDSAKCFHAPPYANPTDEFLLEELKLLLQKPEIEEPDIDPRQYQYDTHGKSIMQHNLSIKEKQNEIDSVDKYFGKALQLVRQFDLYECFKSVPLGQPTKLYEISDKVQQKYGKRPYIHCVQRNGDADMNYVDQINLCFNESFALVDCSEAVSNTFKKVDRSDESNHRIYYSNSQSEKAQFYECAGMEPLPLNSKVNQNKEITKPSTSTEPVTKRDWKSIFKFKFLKR